MGLAQSAGAEGYIFGGYNRFGHSNKIYSATSGSSYAVATMPVGVSGSAAAYSSFNGKIYLFGGFDSTQSYSTIWEFNPSDRTIRTMSARLPEGVVGISAAYYPPTRKIYLFGGTANNEPQSWVLEYNPATDTLVTKTQFSRSRLRTPPPPLPQKNRQATNRGSSFLAGLPKTDLHRPPYLNMIPQRSPMGPRSSKNRHLWNRAASLPPP